MQIVDNLELYYIPNGNIYAVILVFLSLGLENFEQKSNVLKDCRIWSFLLNSCSIHIRYVFTKTNNEKTN